MKLIEGEEFVGQDYTATGLKMGEYENCVFQNCNFLEVNLSNTEFVECKFIDCDLSMVAVNKTAFKEVHFENCKMLGIQFLNVHPFLLDFSFNHCVLNDSGFTNLNLKGIQFHSCTMKSVDFGGANISEGRLLDCDLQGALFERTNLEKADFSSAMNFQLDPDENQIKGTKFSNENVAGLLVKYGVKVI